MMMTTLEKLTIGIDANQSEQGDNADLAATDFLVKFRNLLLPFPAWWNIVFRHDFVDNLMTHDFLLRL